MIGRFGLSGGQSQPANGAGVPGGSSAGNTARHALSKMQSINSLTMAKMNKMNLSDITKKMSAGLNIPIGVDTEKKAKLEAEERKVQILAALTILEDVCLQAPASHSGLILAYYGRDLSPISNPGIRFTWFRMSGEERVDQVAEGCKAWYPPTADDIGCVICVQCEDGFEQGCSRYLECGPIRADPLLVSAAEAVVDYGVHEAKEVCVSLGLAEGEHSVSCSAEEGQPLGTALDRDMAFLQLNGRSAVEVDEQGVFISIPTLGPATSKHGKATFNTSRRGLRIPASAGLSVVCLQPTALVLRLPIRGGGGGAEGASASEEERMRQFLSSSIVAIPWSYEGHHLSPAAYIAEHGPRLSAEERERIVREAEEDGIVFANTVVALAEFVSSLPEGAAEIKICFSCPDRQARDLLAVAIRSLACCTANSTKLERRRAGFPWLGTGSGAGEEAEEEAGQGQDSSSAEGDQQQLQDLRKRLKVMEAETMALRRERNELVDQLLEARDAAAQVQHHGPADKSLPQQQPQQQTVHVDEGRQLLELENRLAVAVKREAEAARGRAELEATNARLAADLERYRRQAEDLGSKAVALQALHDRQAHSLALLEEARAEGDREVQQARRRCKEMEAMQAGLQAKDLLIAESRREADGVRAQLHQAEAALAKAAAETALLQAEGRDRAKQAEAVAARMDQQLAEALLENRRLERELVGLQEVAVSHKAALAEGQRLEGALRRAEAKADQLAAEVNSLQKKAESQGRDLRRTMKENAAAMAEFEKALVRKSEECNDLYFKINEMKDSEAAARAVDSSSNSNGQGTGSSLLRRGSAASSSIFRRLSGADLVPFSSSSAGSVHGSSSGGASDGGGGGGGAGYEG